MQDAAYTSSVAPVLKVHLFGPPTGTPILALHGMGGHGQRWEHWSSHLPDARVIAPDLLGHGRSPWPPPWNIEYQVDAVIAALATHTDPAHTDTPVLVVGHSYGCAVAIALARAVPDRIRALLLLDPAVGLDPERVLAVAESTARNSDYADEAQARADKTDAAWNDVPEALMDAEIAEHLIPAPGGRVTWRVSTAALVGVCNELARPVITPPPGLPITAVQGIRVDPPYMTDQLREVLLAAGARIAEFDCHHMVPQAKAAESAALARDLLTRT